MPTLVVNLEVAPGREEGLREAFSSRFSPAISAQDGFCSVDLLEPEEGQRWLLLIRFATEQQRLAWVATDTHQQVWPLVAGCCERFEAANFEGVG